MTIVSRELGRIANTLNRGVAGIGLSRLAGERSKRESARLDYDLGRNRAYDERVAELHESGRSQRELAGLTAQAELDRRKEPADFNDLMPDPQSAYHFAKHISPGMMGIHQGEKYIQDDNGVTRLQRKDGSFVTKYDRETRRQEEIGFIKSKYKLKSTISDMMARWEERKQRILEMGIPMAGTNADKEIARLNKNLSGGVDILNSPEKMIERLEAQKADLQQYGNYPEEIKRIDREIQTERGKLMTPAQKLAEKQRTMVHEETMALRKIQLETARKALKEIDRTIERKLPPGVKEKAKAIQAQYKSNLKIIEQYQTGYEDKFGLGVTISEEHYNAAVAENENILKYFEKLDRSDPESREGLLDQVIAIGQEMQGEGASQAGKKGTKIDPLGIR